MCDPMQVNMTVKFTAREKQEVTSKLTSEVRVRLWHGGCAACKYNVNNGHAQLLAVENSPGDISQEARDEIMCWSVVAFVLTLQFTTNK